MQPTLRTSRFPAAVTCTNCGNNNPESETPVLYTDPAGTLPVADPFSQQMLYLQINIGFGKSSRVKQQTAVFFPKSFRPDKPVDVLLYFHGFLRDFPGNGLAISDYLNFKACGDRCMNLREEIEASGRNIILVAPTLDDYGGAGKLTQRGKLDVFLDDVMAGIKTHYLKRYYGSDKMKKGRLLIAGHSAGGSVMWRLAALLVNSEKMLEKAALIQQKADALKAKKKPFAKTEAAADSLRKSASIKYRASGFWGFDSIYGGASVWPAFARRFPETPLFMYYNPDGNKNKTATYTQLAAAKKRDNAGALGSLQLLDIGSDKTRNDHFRIVRPSLRERLAALTEKGDGTEWELPYQQYESGEAENLLDELLQELDYQVKPRKKKKPLLDLNNPDKLFLTGKYAPSGFGNFVKVEGKHLTDPRRTFYLLEDVYDSYRNMVDAANKETAAKGEPPLDLRIVSGLRTFEDQRTIWEDKYTGAKPTGGRIFGPCDAPEFKAQQIMKFNSMPATSRHHWGTDMDIFSLESSSFDTPGGIRIYKWLVANAPKFGFCQPYDNKTKTGRTGYEEEKWHWSFISLAKPFLKEYNAKVQLADISVFAGDCNAVTLDVINKYANGIATSCK